MSDKETQEIPVPPHEPISKAELYHILPEYVGKTAQEICNVTGLTDNKLREYILDLGGAIEFTPQDVLRYGVGIDEKEYYYLFPQDRTIRTFEPKDLHPATGRATLYKRRKDEEDEDMISEGRLTSRESNLGSQKFSHHIWEAMHDAFLATSEGEVEAVEKLRESWKIKGRDI